MVRKESKLKLAQVRTEKAVKKTNEKINELGAHTSDLYDALNNIQAKFDLIRKVPQERKIIYKKIKAVKINWKQQVELIEVEYDKVEIRTSGKGAAGVGAGVTVAALGPTAAMGVATTFGVASTGTAISALSGAAATNAALAWLGGGALAAGGGGMVAGNLFITLLGPVGLTIAGVSALVSGLILIKSNAERNRLEDIYTHISNRDTKLFKLAIVELNERISHIVNEVDLLNSAAARIETFGNDYSKMTEAQQHELYAYVALMEASTMLLVNPILGLQPKVTADDIKSICDIDSEDNIDYYRTNKDLTLSLANMLYKIRLDKADKNILAKSLKSNKDFLSMFDISKKDFSVYNIEMTERLLRFKYKILKDQKKNNDTN